MMFVKIALITLPMAPLIVKEYQEGRRHDRHTLKTALETTKLTKKTRAGIE
jgi:hypothetical protein